MYFAIDTGYWATKAYDVKGNYTYFKSQYEKVIHDSISKYDTYKIQFNNEEYLIGEGAEQQEIDYHKSNNILAKLCVLTAIALLTKDTKIKCDIYVTYPLDLHTIKNAFSEYLKTNGYIDFVVDGTQKQIWINDCIPLPQGAVAYYSTTYKSPYVGILDIGGLTVNGCIMYNYNIVKESIFTENLGSIVLRNKIKKELKGKYGINIRDYEISYILQHGLNIDDKTREESKKIIQKIVDNHVSEIINTMRKNNWNVENTPIIGIGGGSIDLNTTLKNRIKHFILHEHPIEANALGVLSVGRALNNDKKNI